MTKLILKKELYKNLLKTGLSSPNAEVCGLLLGKRDKDNSQ